jgi:hypothetical protein
MNMNINFNVENLTESFGDMLDSLTVSNLKSSRDYLIGDYELCKAGKGYNVYVVGDNEADALEIRKRIEAFDLLIDYYSNNYEPYTFEEEA